MNKSSKLHIYPIKQLYSAVELLVDKSDIAAILCTTNPISKTRLEGIQHIHISFADITDAKRFDAFRIEKAQKIKRFLDGLEGIDVLYICCDSGESRSTAVAAAILRYWGRNEMAIWNNIHFHPNPLVYHLQCKAFGLSNTKLRTLFLSQHNKRLFKK